MSARGAYGFRLRLPSGVPQEDLVPVDVHRPEVRVLRAAAAADAARNAVTDDRVVVAGAGGAGFTVTREPATVTLALPDGIPPAGLLHPILTVPMAVLARWAGAVTLHAGAFETAGGAWAVVGARAAGKSTLLAALGARGCAVAADDLLVLDGDRVRPGPACVDLRPDIAARVPGARPVGEIGGRRRFRLSVRTGEAAPRLRGIVTLAWHDGPGIEVRPLPRGDVLALLHGQEYVALLGPTDPTRVLDLLRLPAWRIARPRTWSVTDALCDRLLSLAADQPRLASHAA